jgi:hypothetical protein
MIGWMTFTHLTFSALAVAPVLVNQPLRPLWSLVGGGSSFFFKRGETNLDNPNVLWLSIAFDFPAMTMTTRAPN